MEKHTARDVGPVRLEHIRLDGGTQPRATIAEDVVSEYAEAMTDGADFPPIEVFFDGVDYWLADGFHRYHAGKKLGLVEVPAKIHAGTRREAVLFSVGVNQGHGLRRTNADKRKAVLTLMHDAEWCLWSNVEIGRRCGVSHELANVVRRSLAESASDKPAPRTYTTRQGTVATMETENIGKAGRDRSRAGVQQRVEQMRELAAAGNTSRQIAAAVGLSEMGCRNSLKREGIDVPADRVVGKAIRHDSTRIVEQMVMDAEHLTADVGLIRFSDLDSKSLKGWIARLNTSRRLLDSFIKQLVKESKKHVEAA